MTSALTTAEREILALAARNVSREGIVALRDVKPSTLKKQVQAILAKLDARSLDNAAMLYVLEELIGLANQLRAAAMHLRVVTRGNSSAETPIGIVEGVVGRLDALEGRTT